MRQERSYSQPSCVLQVWWDGGDCLDDRFVLQQLGFILRFRDDQSLAGDLAQLWALVSAIDGYIQKILSHDYLSAGVHQVLGLRLSSVQLVDASNAIEELRGEVLLLPARPVAREPWVNSVIVGVTALAIGALAGLWLASRQSRISPSVVVAPAPEVFTDPPPRPPEPVPPPPVPERPAQFRAPLPPIRVYPRPEEPSPPPIVEEVPPEEPPVQAARELVEPATAPPAPITIENVEIASSPALAEDLITYLNSVPLPQGQITIDVTVAEGVVQAPVIENVSPEDSANLTNLLNAWIPIEPSGRVRLQIAVPPPPGENP